MIRLCRIHDLCGSLSDENRLISILGRSDHYQNVGEFRLLNKQFWVMPRAWSRLQVSNFGLRGPFFDAHSVCRTKSVAAKSASDLRRAAADFAAAEFARITPRKRWLVARDFHWILLCTLSSSLGVGITSVAFILLDILL